MAATTSLLSIFLIILLAALAVPSSVIGFEEMTSSELSDSFKKFSTRLFRESNSVYSEAVNFTGVGIMSPLGVGLVLANLADQVWNVSIAGIPEFLGVANPPRVGKVFQEYSNLLWKLKSEGLSTKSVLYVQEDRNSAVTGLPEGSQKLRTELVYSDFLEEWQTFREMVSSTVALNSGGKLGCENFLPRESGLFQDGTRAMYINTNHFRWEWKQKWTSIGRRNFTDKASVPFIQTEGIFPLRETRNYIAIAIPLGEDNRKYFVFVRPNNGQFTPFMNEDLPCPSLWRKSRVPKILQVPQFSFTLQDQHYSMLGKHIPETFCSGNHPGERPYFSGPIVQTNHVQVTKNFFEVASSTGVTINHETPQDERRNGYKDPWMQSLKPPIAKQHPPECDSEDDNLIQFNRPFWWYFYDRDLTLPLYHGAVRSFLDFRENHHHAGAEAQTDLVRLWFCKKDCPIKKLLGLI